MIKIQVFFPKSGWTTLTIEGFKTEEDAEQFAKVIQEKLYPTNV